jgi:hypothetical protein
VTQDVGVPKAQVQAGVDLGSRTLLKTVSSHDGQARSRRVGLATGDVYAGRGCPPMPMRKIQKAAGQDVQRLTDLLTKRLGTRETT